MGPEMKEEKKNGKKDNASRRAWHLMFLSLRSTIIHAFHVFSRRSFLSWLLLLLYHTWPYLVSRLLTLPTIYGVPSRCVWIACPYQLNPERVRSTEHTVRRTSCNDQGSTSPEWTLLYWFKGRGGRQARKKRRVSKAVCVGSAYLAVAHYT